MYKGAIISTSIKILVLNQEFNFSMLNECSPCARVFCYQPCTVIAILSFIQTHNLKTSIQIFQPNDAISST